VLAAAVVFESCLPVALVGFIVFVVLSLSDEPKIFDFGFSSLMLPEGVKLSTTFSLSVFISVTSFFFDTFLFFNLLIF